MRLSHDNSELIIAIPGRQAAGCVRGGLHRRTRGGRGQRHEAGRHPVPGEHPVPPGRGAQRSRFRRAARRVGDIYVNDAFSVAHRAHASVEGIAHRLPTYAGRTMQDELEALTKVLQNPIRPLAAIVGGAKVSTKLDLLGSLLSQRSTLPSSAVAWPTRFWPRANIPWANRCASAISCRPRARSWPRRRPKAVSSYCRWTPWLPKRSRRTRLRA